MFRSNNYPSRGDDTNYKYDLPHQYMEDNVPNKYSYQGEPYHKAQGYQEARNSQFGGGFNGGVYMNGISKAYGRNETNCLQCGSVFPNSQSLASHFCPARKIHSYNYQCAQCGQSFIKYDLYLRHMDDGCQHLTAPVLHKLPAVDKKFPSSVSSPSSTGIETKPIRTHDDRLPNQVNNSKAATLFFGGVVRPDSLIGGAAWWICDTNKKMVTYGSIYVHQTFPSLVRLEYEALLNGLRAACLNNIGRLTITGSSTLLLNQLNSQFQLPYFKTVYHQNKDLNSAIDIVIRKLQYFETEIISVAGNYYAYKLAEKAIVKYEKRKSMNVDKIFSEAQKKKATDSPPDAHYFPFIDYEFK